MIHPKPGKKKGTVNYDPNNPYDDLDPYNPYTSSVYPSNKTATAVKPNLDSSNQAINIKGKGAVILPPGYDPNNIIIVKHDDTPLPPPPKNEP